MNFLQLAKKRYSTRKYSNQPVADDMLNYILEAGRVAPSAANLQPWYFIVVTDTEVRRQLWEVYQRPWFRDAPVVLVLCADHHRSWKRGDGKDHADIDLAIAADHMTLAAAELGLGTCWICHFDQAACRRVFQLPDHIEPVILLSLGYPLDEGNPDRHNTQRKPMVDIVRFDKF